MISPASTRCSSTSTPTTPRVLVAAKRARQINSYYHNLGEGRSTSSRRRWSNRLEELPDDRPRGGRRGQDQVPLPVAGRSPSGRQASWPGPARRQRRDRRLQGAGVRAPGDEGRARRPGRADPDGAALRRRRLVCGAQRRAGARPTSSSATRRAAPSPASRRRTTIRSATWSSSRNADAYLIAPASANTIAKLAHGLADNLLTSAALAATCPVVVAPAMNNHMYEHAGDAGQPRDAARARRTVLDPGVGALGSKGEWGVGRLAEPRRAAGAPSRPSSPGGARSLERPARARHRRRHPRADRLRALRRQPLARAAWASRSPRRPPRSAPT